jgi:hypothetical protein
MIVGGHPDVAGLCLALSDWSTELRILRNEGKDAERTSTTRKIGGRPPRNGSRRSVGSNQLRRSRGRRYGNDGHLERSEAMPALCGRSRLRKGTMRPQPQRETPPGAIPAARFGANWRTLSLDRVAAFPVLALRGHDRHAHLLGNRARQEPTHGMRLPSGRFHQLLARYAAGTLQQIEHFGGLAAIPGTLGFRRALGRFLGRGCLLPRLSLLGRHVRATCARVGLFSWALRPRRLRAGQFQSVL